MGKPTGFLEITREPVHKRPVEERVRDWREVYLEPEPSHQKQQAARCMDCGVPFCNQGCPLGNLIPDWNDLVYRDRWRDAIEALHKTNNFPEFTGRICPAPCEAACVLSINDNPVTIKMIENSIIDRAFAEGWIKAQPPTKRTGKKVAVIGSGPAGLAAAAQLNKAGHMVTVFERAQRAGGLLTFGIPDFKLEKRIVDRRLDLLQEEGIEFRCGVNVGVDVTMEQLQREYDSVLLAIGACDPRKLGIPGSDLKGVYFAVDYLTAQNEKNYGDPQAGHEYVDAHGKNVIIIGGGDTGADCYGTAIRQGAKSVRLLEFLPTPPQERDKAGNPWPQWPRVFTTAPAHEEGGERHWSIQTKELQGNDKGHLKKLVGTRLEWSAENGKQSFKPAPNGEFSWDADLIFIAIGYAGPEKKGPVEQLGVELDSRGNVKTGANFMTSIDGVFAAGDAHRGQSLVVWAIAEGRKAARGIDLYLMGSSDLP